MKREKPKGSNAGGSQEGREDRIGAAFLRVTGEAGLERQAEEENGVSCRITPSFGPTESLAEKVSGMGWNNAIQFAAQHQGGTGGRVGAYLERIGSRALEGEPLGPGAGAFGPGLAPGGGILFDLHPLCAPGPVPSGRSDNWPTDDGDPCGRYLPTASG